jgi:hypothetical protein
MATIDDLYTQRALALKEWTPLRQTLASHAADWTAAVAQLGLPTPRVTRPPMAPPAPVPGALPAKPYAPADLATIAAAYVKTKAQHDAAKGIVDTIDAQIREAIAAKGA